jgi:hypothetical protein
MNQCTHCGMIEGFTDQMPSHVAPDLPSQMMVGMPQPPADYKPFMKSECNYAAQPCIYTAQGTMLCPKEGLGACSQNEKQQQPFFGLF